MFWARGFRLQSITKNLKYFKVTQNLLIMRNLSMFLKHLEKNAILIC